MKIFTPYFRDLKVKKHFDREPLLWNILELVASGELVLREARGRGERAFKKSKACFPLT